MVGESTWKTQRILYVAHQACGNPALCAKVRAHAAAGADVLVVAPVLSSPLHRWMSDELEDRALAEGRLEESIGCLRRHGLRARGMLGDADPVQAIADALFGFPADEIVICLEEPERPHWLRKGVVERARERFQVPVTELDVAREPAAFVQRRPRAAALGIRQVGVHRGPGAGSVSETATGFGRECGISVIDGGCHCMFGQTADSGHKAMRLLFTLTGKTPGRV